MRGTTCIGIGLKKVSLGVGESQRQCVIMAFNCTYVFGFWLSSVEWNFLHIIYEGFSHLFDTAPPYKSTPLYLYLYNPSDTRPVVMNLDVIFFTRRPRPSSIPP